MVQSTIVMLSIFNEENVLLQNYNFSIIGKYRTLTNFNKIPIDTQTHILYMYWHNKKRSILKQNLLIELCIKASSLDGLIQNETKYKIT